MFVQYVAETFDITEDQSVMVYAWTASFLLQAGVLLFSKPDKFSTKWFIVCLILCTLYNIYYFKLFL